METDVMIRQLRCTAKKHENDTLHTFDTNISAMCTDVANKLEELQKENKEIRTKAIEEFADAVKAEIANCSWQFSRLEAETIDNMARELKGE